MNTRTRVPWVVFSILAVFVLSVPATHAAYVGSARCMPCHRQIYESWKDTLHNKSQQVLNGSNDTVVVAWQGNVKLKAGNIPEVTVALSKGPGGNYQATLIDAKDPSQQVVYSLIRTYGGWGWKQRYLTKIGGNDYILPIQWNQVSSRWVPYNLQSWYNEDGSLKKPVPMNSFEAKCAGCHNTGLELKKVNEGYESKYVELNAGCEKCHGPGSSHAKIPRVKGLIVNPRKLPYDRAIEACGQCHNRGVSVPNGTFEFPWDDKNNKPYKLGEPLANYYKFKPGVWLDPQSHSLQHHQQWIDFLKSGHFKGKVTCFDCHNAHGGPSRSQLVKADYNNNLCLSCHGRDKRFSNAAAIRMHTKHNYAPETTGVSRCSSCHLVKVASSAEAGDIHSHTFGVIKPEVSLDMFKKTPAGIIPNSCNGCHRNWAKDQAGYEMGAMKFNALFGK